MAGPSVDRSGNYLRTMRITNVGRGDRLEPLRWETVRERLNAGEPPAVGAPNQRTTWLTTVNADGSPHVTAVGALWLDGAFWFQTGAATVKASNVARDPRCAIATSILEMDVVAEGSAERVDDAATVARLARAWADQGWPVEPDDEGTGLTAPFNAPGLGPAPWQVYRMALRSVTAVLGVEPGGSTRFTF